MPTTPTKLGLLAATTIVWLVLPATANADTQTNITFDGMVPGEELAAQGYVAIAVDSYSTRTPIGVTELDYQQQCSGDTYAGAVDSLAFILAEV